MTHEEITALAREYAEEATKADAGDPNLSATDLNGIRHDVAEYAEEVIQFLLRRYCLVKKSKVESVYNTTWNSWYHTLDVETKGKNQCVLDVLHFLFPEIAKEVEG